MTDPRELLQAYLDEELTAAECEQVEAALAADPVLRQELATLQAAGELVRSSAQPAMPEELTTMIRDRITAVQRPWWEALLGRRTPHLSLGALTTLALCLFLAPMTRSPELPRLTRDVYVTVNDSMTTQADGARPMRMAELAPPEIAESPAPPYGAVPAEAEAVSPYDSAPAPAAMPDSAMGRPALPRTRSYPAGETAMAAVEGVPAGAPEAKAAVDMDAAALIPPAGRNGIVHESAEEVRTAPAPLLQVPVTPIEALPRLQAGEVDDNEKFSKYVAYAESQAGLASRGVTVFPVRERYVIQVVDQDGVGVPDAQIQVRNVGGRDTATPLYARTDASGQAVFFPAQSEFQDQTLSVVAYGPNPQVGPGQGQQFRRRNPSQAWRVTVDAAWRRDAGRTVDIAFVVDTTGSMSEEISRLRETIDQVVKLLDKSAERPKLRFGLVLYRDLGDAYVTKVRDFTTNVEGFRRSLDDVRADGGGDTPEHVQAALAAAVGKLTWTEEPALRMAFLIGDAPPHLDYQQDDVNPPYLQSVDRARAKGIKFFTISTSGNDDVGEYVWRQIALLTRGKFLFITKGDALGDVPDRPAQPDDGSTPHHVERQDYTVQALPNLIEQCVRRELAALGTRPPTTIDVGPMPTQPEPAQPGIEPAPVVHLPAQKKLPFSATLLIVLSNLAGWLWAWRRSLRPTLRRR